jgi:aminoglycoside N3'-acetyltransferase
MTLAPALPGASIAEELIDALVELGLRRGDTLMVHSAWTNLSGLASSPAALIQALRNLVGPQGTLCMPAHAARGWPRTGVFDIRRTPSGTGLVTEVFRRTEGVRRSYHLNSVAAVGAVAPFLLDEHHQSPYAAGPLSPYARLAEVGGWVACLGVGPESNTMFHCGEDVLQEEFPVRVYGPAPRILRVCTEAGRTLDVPMWYRDERWTYCCDPVRLLPYFPDLILHRVLGSVDLFAMPSRAFLERLLFLAGKGIHMYGFRFPTPAAVLASASGLVGAAPPSPVIDRRNGGWR